MNELVKIGIILVLAIYGASRWSCHREAGMVSLYNIRVHSISPLCEHARKVLSQKIGRKTKSLQFRLLLSEPWSSQLKAFLGPSVLCQWISGMNKTTLRVFDSWTLRVSSFFDLRSWKATLRVLMQFHLQNPILDLIYWITFLSRTWS